jgi:PAS domain S-box-containing protein
MPVHFLKNLELVSKAMNSAKDVEHIIDDVLEAVFSIFDCDRIWLFHPCDPNATSFRVLAEKTKPEYPGAFATGQELPMSAEAAGTISKALTSGSPVVFGPESENKIDDISTQFSVLSQIVMAIHPKTGEPWMFGMHQCSHARVWSIQEQLLFKEISFRVVEGINNLILLRDLRTSERKLRESEERYALALRAANIGTWDWNLKTGGLKWSEQIEPMFGFSKGQFGATYDAFLDCLHPDDRKHVVDSVTDALYGGKEYDIEHRIIWPDKSIRWVSEKGKVYRDEDGEPLRLLGVVLDITEQKNSFERFRTVLDSIDALVYVADMETYELLFVNKYGREIWGDIIGKICWQSLQSGQSGPCEFCTNDKLLDADLNPTGPYIWEFQNTADNEWYECRDQAIHWLDGRIVRMEIASNITHRKEADAQKNMFEEKLRQSQKMESIGTLAGGIAHDFNNILGVIIGYADMARIESSPLSKTAQHLTEVLKAGNRAKELVKQILAFSRQADAERIALQPATIVKEAVKMLRPSLPATIEINLNIATETSAIFADPTQIHQILINLCTNAFHAMEETGGKLDISLQETKLSAENLVKEQDVEAGNFVELSISDSGPGIAPEIKDNIFDPYFTTKEAGKGTGLGLSVVHGIVKSYGGVISLESEPGKGTAVHVFIPAIAGDTTPVPEDKGADQVQVGTEHILFIDDEEMIAMMGKNVFEMLGYKITLSTNSQEALQIFQNQPDQFDLIITDQTMPGMTGVELAREVLALRPNIPIILCTGFSSIISEKQAKAIGIKEFVLKPYSTKYIAKLTRKALDGESSVP